MPLGYPNNIHAQYLCMLATMIHVLVDYSNVHLANGQLEQQVAKETLTIKSQHVAE